MKRNQLETQASGSNHEFFKALLLAAVVDLAVYGVSRLMQELDIDAQNRKDVTQMPPDQLFYHQSPDAMVVEQVALVS